MIMSRVVHRRSLSLLLELVSCVLFVANLGLAEGANEPIQIDQENDQVLIDELSQLIQYHIRDKALPSIAIALVRDESIVWSQGFGYEDKSRTKPATSKSVYRVGSVSKLFTDVAVMQLCEKNVAALDAPVSSYLNDFDPVNSFGREVTLRHLMAHRSGLVREPPKGHYFDASGPSLRETVQSLNTTELLYEPGSRTKYSNAGVSVVGLVLEELTKKPFEVASKETLLNPLDLKDTDFVLREDLKSRLAYSQMWGYDGRRFDAPLFQLGTSSAGNLYSTADDLASFLIALFEAKDPGAKAILTQESLAEMFRPQYEASGNGARGFGLGFVVSSLDGRRLVRHGGAVYGYATELAALPDSSLGVAVITSLDGANSVVEEIGHYALRGLSALERGDVDWVSKSNPMNAHGRSLTAKESRALEGTYEGGASSIRLVAQNENLVWEQGPMFYSLKLDGSDLVVDSILGGNQRISISSRGVLTRDGAPYKRVEQPCPKAPPSRHLGLIGEYGWDHNILYILERDEKLYALIEWFYLYPLKEIDEHTFAFPNSGLYVGEKIVFERDRSEIGRVAVAAGIRFERRDIGTRNGETFRIDPVRPIEDIRKGAMAASPPKEVGKFRDPDLVDLETLDSSIRLDIRYATTNNFMNSVFYKSPKAFMQRPAAEALVRVHRKLEKDGFGVLIHDAYRPWFVTKMFWDATPEDLKIFVADPEKGSRHNRGCAVDLTLFSRSTGEVIEMIGGYDEFSDRSFADYPGGTSKQRFHREVLRAAMESEGFKVYEYEWWHFDYKDWTHYPIQEVVFEDISK